MADEIKIEEKGLSIVISGIDKRPIKIPSAMYPLNDTRYMLTIHNTLPFPDTERTAIIKKVFNSIDDRIGTCYSNTENLIDALEKEGIQGYPFVGWLFIGGAFPVHHCFTVIKNEDPEIDKVHILDFAFNFELLDLDGKYKELDGEENLQKTREEMVNDLIEIRKRPHSEACVFGQAFSRQVYIVCPCKPSVGLNTYRKLIKTYPKHPCYRNIENGTNETQRLYLQKTGGLK